MEKTTLTPFSITFLSYQTIEMLLFNFFSPLLSILPKIIPNQALVWTLPCPNLQSWFGASYCQTCKSVFLYNSNEPTILSNTYRIKDLHHWWQIMWPNLMQDMLCCVNLSQCIIYKADKLYKHAGKCKHTFDFGFGQLVLVRTAHR